MTRRNRQSPASEALQSTPRAEPVVQDTGDVNRGSVTFAEPLSSALPSSSTAQAPVDPPSVFATHHVPEDEVNAAREAIRQAGIMMEKMKMVRDASQAAYDASSALQSNVQVSRLSEDSFRKSLRLYTHWVRRLKFWTSGGTLSAPTGCSPRDYGGLLAVDCSLCILPNV